MKNVSCNLINNKVYPAPFSSKAPAASLVPLVIKFSTALLTESNSKSLFFNSFAIKAICSYCLQVLKGMIPRKIQYCLSLKFLLSSVIK